MMFRQLCTGTFAEGDDVRRGTAEFYESTFIKHANKPEYSDYILFHYLHLLDLEACKY